MGTTGEALNAWWLRLMKSMTNFVYASNFDSKTHKILQLNAKITSQVNFDYNPIGRKISNKGQNYEDENNSLD